MTVDNPTRAGEPDATSAPANATGAAPGSASDQSADIVTMVGDFGSETLVAKFREDDTFAMAASDGSQSVEGSFAVDQDVIRFYDVSGDAAGMFPMRCRFERDGATMVLHRHQDSCRALDQLELSQR